MSHVLIQNSHQLGVLDLELLFEELLLVPFELLALQDHVQGRLQELLLGQLLGHRKGL